MYEIKCPKCESVWMVKCESIVHSENEKSLKQLILEEAFFTRKCSQCDEFITFYYPFLYFDLKRHFLIALVVDDEINWINELDALDMYKAFNKRIVYNGKQLKEKILIFENKLYDEGIQKIKTQLMNKYNEIYFDCLEDEILWFQSDKGLIGVEKRFYRDDYLRHNKFVHI